MLAGFNTPHGHQNRENTLLSLIFFKKTTHKGIRQRCVVLHIHQLLQRLL
jgi:hypothetical protein